MVACSGDCGGIQRLGNIHLAFAVVGGFNTYVKLVCKAPFEIVGLRITSIVLDSHRVGDLRIGRRIDGLVVIKKVFVQSRLVHKFQIEARTYRNIVHKNTVRITLRSRYPTAERQG